MRDFHPDMEDQFRETLERGDFIGPKTTHGAEDATRYSGGVALALLGVGLSVLLLKLAGAIIPFAGIGSLFLLIGFCVLWKESNWFKVCVFLAMLQTAWCGYLLFGGETAVDMAYEQTNLFWHGSHIVCIGLLLCMWKGLYHLDKKANAISLALLLLGYAALIGLSYAGAGCIALICKLAAVTEGVVVLLWVYRQEKDLH